MRTRSLMNQLYTKRLPNGRIGLYCDNGLLREIYSERALEIYLEEPGQILTEWEEKYSPKPEAVFKPSPKRLRTFKPVITYYCEETGKTYNSAEECAADIGMSPKAIGGYIGKNLESKKHPKWHIKRIVVKPVFYVRETGKIYNTIKELAEVIGYSKAYTGRILAGAVIPKGFDWHVEIVEREIKRNGKEKSNTA